MKPTRPLAAVVLVFFSLAAGHLAMIGINDYDAILNSEYYANTQGEQASWFGDKPLLEELETLQAKNPDALLDIGALDKSGVYMLPSSPFLGWVAILMGVIGIAFLVLSKFFKNDGVQSLLGIFGALFLWTGPVEYGLMLASRTLGVAKSVQIVGGEVVGAYGEYVLLKYTWGLLFIVFIYQVFVESNRGPFFMWLRRKFKLMRGSTANGRIDNYGPRSAFQYITMMWWFYVVLLWAWDPVFAGGVGGWLDKLVLGSSLSVSGWLFFRLSRKTSAGPALRYAIATTIIFWNCIEIMAKWNIFNEPWLLFNPGTSVVFFGGLAVGVTFFVRELRLSGVKAS